MARTYKYEPFLIPNIFSELVGQVETNLTNDANLTIPFVAFKHGNWNDIKEELIKQGNSLNDYDKGRKYPLVCLIHSFDETYQANQDEISVDIVILTPCKPNEHIPFKYSSQGNYQNILNPIYAELVSVIKKSRYFDGYLQKMSFPKRDLIHFTSVDSGDSYVITDFIDGIVMQGLKLKLNKPACQSVQCVPIYEVDSIYNINYVSLTQDNNTNIVNLRFNTQTTNVSEVFTGFCTDDFIQVDNILPNVDYPFDLTNLVGSDMVTNIELTSSNGSYIKIPVEIKDGAVVLTSIVIASSFSVNTSCGNYLPMSLVGEMELLAIARVTNISVKPGLSGSQVVVFNKSISIDNEEPLYTSDEFNAVPLLLPQTDQNFYIDTFYTSNMNDANFQNRIAVKLKTI